MGKHESRSPEPGAVIIADKYRVERTIARGGMGVLLEAHHLLMKRPVAIKVLRDQRKASRGRLIREARAMQSLSSEHVARVFDVGVHDGEPFIVMELLSGIDLAQRVAKDGPLSLSDAVDCLLEACVATHEAHRLGIVHRDLKPANLFCATTTTGERVKVLDFGISKVDEPEDDDLDATADNAVLGTPNYMSPEQLRNPRRVDERTDVWALGVTLFYVLTGELPFHGASAREVTAAVYTDAPRTLRSLLPDAPLAVNDAIARALEKLPADRTPNVATLATELAVAASARGQRALQRMQQTTAPTPHVAQTSTTGPATTTEAGVASTIGDAPAAEPLPPSPRPQRSWWLAAAAIITVAAIVAATPAAAPQRERAPASTSSVGMGSFHPVPNAEAVLGFAPKATSPAPPEATASPAPADSLAAPPRTGGAPAPPQAPTPPQAPPARPTPPPARPNALPAPLLVDIDGVPIVK